MQLRDGVVIGLASFFGLGYLPKAPGTWGTLGAIPVWWAVSRLGLLPAVVVTLAAVAVATWVSAAAENIYGSHDVQHIVIDEVVGLMVATVAVPFRWSEVVAAFVIFRILDMTKPPPIGWLDRRVGGGFGVVIDDVVAGLFTLALLHGARWLLGGWW